MKNALNKLLTFIILCIFLPAFRTAASDGVPYMSYDSGGHSLGEQTCSSYKTFGSNLIVSDWFDLNDTNGGWYVVSSNVIMGSNTTMRITGDVHLILCDGVTVSVGDGVYIRKGSSLSIYGQSKGTGKLVSKPDSGPGIGGMAGTVAGSLYIHGGQIEAKGGTNAAGIGGGNHSSGYQNIVIYGGKVTATGGSSAAGIGKGQQNSPGDCGLIAIYGGEVTATSSKYGAGIGGGEDRDGGTIRIYGGTVKATGGHDGSGIGGGEGGSGGNIRIEGGTVTAQGGNHAAGIGGGENGASGGTICITGGTVETKGGMHGAGIGGGENGDSGAIEIQGGTIRAYGAYGKEDKEGVGTGIGGGKDGNIDKYIIISGGDVYAEGAHGRGGAGIGAAERGDMGDDGKSQGGPVTISGGTVVAKGGTESAGIGGSGKKGHGGTVTVTGGDVTAYGGYHSAGIGGSTIHDGYSSAAGHGGNFTITDGIVRAFGGSRAAGIGGGRSGAGGSFTVRGGTVEAMAGEEASAIGGGQYGDGGTVTIEGGTVTAYFDLADNHLSAEAIGQGKDDIKLDSGSLTLYPGARVYDMISGMSFPVSQRIPMCRSHIGITIGPCDHTDCTYKISESGHTKICKYCLTGFEEERHVYAEGHCETCGYDGEGDMVTVSFAPGNIHAAGEMTPDAFVPGTSQPLPICGFELSGFEFAGWQSGVDGKIYPAGQEYVMNQDTVFTATWHNGWTDLQDEIDSAPSGAVILLKGNTTASQYNDCLSVPSGKDITLDLNGYVLSRGMNAAEKSGHVLTNNGSLTIVDSIGGGIITGGSNADETQGGGIVNNGTLTLQSGSVSGNYGYMAGAVLNMSDAEFLMTGGELIGNACRLGGGGAVVNYGSMTMTGGRITGNTSGQNGGGIWNSGELTISGGTISGNTAGDKGGGIYARGTSILTLSGAPVITDNRSSGRGTSNLHCSKDNGQLATIRAGAFAEGMHVGLSSTTVPTEAVPVTLVTGVSGGSAKDYFRSDNPLYEIVQADGSSDLLLQVRTVYTVSLKAGDGIGEDLTVSSADQSAWAESGTGVSGRFLVSGSRVLYSFPDLPESFSPPEGMSFRGWTIDGGTDVYQSGIHVLPLEKDQYILTAQWEKHYQITWANMTEAVWAPECKAEAPEGADVPVLIYLGQTAFDAGTRLESLTVSGSGPEPVILTRDASDRELKTLFPADIGNGTVMYELCFTMPAADVTVTASFRTDYQMRTPDFILPSGVTSIQEEAFEGAAMTVVYIRDGCTSIGDGAFRDCTDLCQIRIPAGCTISPTAFDGCGTVYVFAPAGSPAESFCETSDHCEFVAD